MSELIENNLISEKMPLVSVILPIYNVEKWIRKCLDSICNQTYQNIEVLLVNDGSKDSSREICEEYVNKDKRFFIIDKKNGGLVSAWKCGLQHSNSEWICFVDPDDWISEKHIEILVSRMLTHKVNLVIGPKCNINTSSNEISKRFIRLNEGYYDKQRLVGEVYPNMINNGDFHSRAFPVSRWGKLIRKQLIIDNLIYTDDRVSYSEDLNIIIPVVLSADSLYVENSDEALYFYRYNPESMLNKYDKNMLYSIKHVYPALLTACKDKAMDEVCLQVKSDLVAAGVQYYKTELINPRGLKNGVRNIEDFAKWNLLEESIKVTNWKKYKRKLNVIIIYSLENTWAVKLIAPFLKFLKVYSVKRKNK